MGEQLQTLLMIAVGSALVNNVVLSQFLGLCPFLGVSKKMETAAGMGGAVIFLLFHRADLSPSAGACRAGISADHRIYPGDRGPGTAGGNVSEENHTVPVQEPGRIPAADHHQLRGAGRGSFKCPE